VTSEQLLFLAVEEAIPADHPAAWLAVPLGLVFFGGSVFLLLWSNYGAKKAAAIYGVAFFGFSFLIGVFWWFGGPGIPPGLGISHLPGQSGDHYNERWFAFEQGSDRDAFFAGTDDLSAFQSVEVYAGLEGADQETIEGDPFYASVVGSVGASVEGMQAQFFPVDDNGVAQIGAERRAQLEEEAQAAQPEGSRRAADFYTVVQVGDPLVRDDPDTDVLLATQEFQVQATFVDDDGVPVEVVDVGPSENWFAFYDPGANWIPSALWTIISLVGFLLSLLWLDRLELRDKRLLADEVEAPQDLEVPIAQ
jgi:hypothetical protein